MKYMKLFIVLSSLTASGLIYGAAASADRKKANENQAIYVIPYHFDAVDKGLRILLAKKNEETFHLIGGQMDPQANPLDVKRFKIKNLLLNEKQTAGEYRTDLTGALNNNGQIINYFVEVTGQAESVPSRVRQWLRPSQVNRKMSAEGVLTALDHKLLKDIEDAGPEKRVVLHSMPTPSFSAPSKSTSTPNN